MSVIPRPTSLAARAGGSGRGRGDDRTPSRHGGSALGTFELRFAVSAGGLRRSELGGEFERCASERTGPSSVPVSIRVVVHPDGGCDPSAGSVPVRGRAEIELDEIPLGMDAASFAIVGTLRGVLTRGTRRLHLDLADGAGPWLRWSVPAPEECGTARRVPDAPAAAPMGRGVHGSPEIRRDAVETAPPAYAWLRPFCDWRIPGGTASPREVRCIPHRSDETHHAAAGS